MNEIKDLFDQLLYFVFWSTVLIIISLIVFKLGVWVYKLIMRWQIIIEKKSAVLLKISVPKYRNSVKQSEDKSSSTKNKINTAEQMFSELRGIIPSDWRKHLIYRETLSFEIVATAVDINFYVYCSRKLIEFVKNSIFAAYPDSEINEVTDYFDSLPRINMIFGYIRLIGPEYSPIRTYETMDNDSLNLLLSKMSNLRGKEVLIIQTYATPVSGSWRHRAYKYLEYLMRGQNNSNNQTKKSQDSTVWVGNSIQMAIDSDLYKGIEK